MRVGTSINGQEMHTLGGDHPHACGDKLKIGVQCA